MKIFFAGNVTTHDEYYKKSGYEVVYDKDINCNFSGPILESSYDTAKNYCIKNDLTHQNFDILNKTYLLETCENLGIPILPMVLLDSASKLDQFRSEPFILKPSIGSGSFSTDNFAYKIFDSVEDFLSNINDTDNFFKEKKYYIQKSVVTSNELALLLVVTGFINGKQDIIFNDIVENFQENGHPILTNIQDLPEYEVALVKKYTTDILLNKNISNTPFQLQFIRKPNGSFYAIDFQYRIGFHYYGITIDHHYQYYKDLLDFTYDLKKLFDFQCYTYLKKIDNINVSNPKVNDLCEEMKICVVFGGLLSDNKYVHRPKMYRNITFSTISASSRKEAKSIMDIFEERVKLL